METKYCQTAQRKVVQSQITGNELVVNTSPDRFLVLENAPYEKMSALVSLLRERFAQPDLAGRVESRLLQSLLAFEPVKDAEELALAIDEAIESTLAVELQRGGQKMRTIMWLQRLWVEGFIAFPARLPFVGKVALFLDAFGLCQHFSWVIGLKGASSSVNLNRIPGLATTFAATASGVKECGDLIPFGVNARLLSKRRRILAGLVTPLLAMQRSMYGEKAVYTVKDWGLTRKSRGHDRTYYWVTEKDSSLEDWRERISIWLQEGRSLALRTYMADRLFAYLLDHPSLPRTVEEYCRRSAVLTTTWAEWAAQQSWADSSRTHYINLFADFIDWYICRYLTADDDFGRPVVSPNHYNPITRMGTEGKASQTHREALPLRYIHELISIIQADDYAWPKSLSSDYFMWHNPATGKFEKTWSPVRAIALLFKLHLPLRTFQVRMLDSGEGDSEVFENGRWVVNTGPLVPSSKKSVTKGFLRKLYDTATSRHFTGMYVNTNKTADIYRDAKDTGYEIPWQHEEVIRLTEFLLAWQKRYNPIQQPLDWSRIHDKSVLRSHSQEALRQRGDICFLFRDPKGAYAAEPVVDSRLQSYWAMLLRELERRVADRGERLPDGSPIRFVKPYKDAAMLPAPLFDLHSLRVSLITAYAVEGGVPIQVLSKCVAGHATVLMTLYYTKPGPAYVSEQLVKAQEKIQRQEQANFVRFLQDAAIREASPLVVTNDAGALSALGGTEASGWVIGDVGICPVGMGRCHQGGPKASEATMANRYLPVPGGAKNCVRCRFLVTGPAFLGGLVALFNSTGVKLMEAAERLRRLEAQICAAEDNPAGGEDLGRYYARRDSVLEEVDLLAHNWHATYGLIERCKAALHSSAKEKGISLVLTGSMGDLETALAECTDFDLYNAVCQSAIVYPSEGTTLSNLRRGRLLDAMLTQNGRRPVFASLSEEEALAIGNEFVSLLISRLGHHDTIALIEGQRMLETAGITKEIDRFLAGQRLKPMPQYSAMKRMPSLADFTES